MQLSYFNLKDKVSIITGAAGLLGQEHCRAMHNAGCKVVAIDVNYKNLKKLNEKINCDIYECDITNKSKILNLKSKILKKYKKVDILINNAAIDYPIKKKIKKLHLKIFQLASLEKKLKLV